uniref:Uncharacterized protein n=1 Tax=Chenopodium quinoa TaxID=63459 RepID=A0A803MIP2_CHEQI
MDNTKLEQCRKLSEEIDQLQLLEESYWHVRARTNELRDGDKNTSYFHHKASARKAKNMIVGLEDSNGQWIQDEKGISEVVTNYFSQLFTTEGVVDFDEALMGITHGITETMNDELCMVPTANEDDIAIVKELPLVDVAEPDSLFWTLTSSREIWVHCHIWEEIQIWLSEVFHETLANMIEGLSSFDFCLFATLAWAAWTSRNKSLFEEGTHVPQ